MTTVGTVHLTRTGHETLARNEPHGPTTGKQPEYEHPHSSEIDKNYFTSTPGSAQSQAISPILTQAPPGDRVLWSVANQSNPTPLIRDIQSLFEHLQLHVAKTDTSNIAMLRVELAQLGKIEVRLTHAANGLHIEIQAAAGSIQQLQTARSELLERLQRLDPGQQVSLAFSSNNSDQGSRHKRHVYEEWLQDQ